MSVELGADALRIMTVSFVMPNSHRGTYLDVVLWQGPNEDGQVFVGKSPWYSLS